MVPVNVSTNSERDDPCKKEKDPIDHMFCIGQWAPNEISDHAFESQLMSAKEMYKYQK